MSDLPFEFIDPKWNQLIYRAFGKIESEERKPYDYFLYLDSEGSKDNIINYSVGFYPRYFAWWDYEGTPQQKGISVQFDPNTLKFQRIFSGRD